MKHLEIKFKCAKHREDQLILIKQIRTYMMIFKALVAAGHSEAAEQYLDSSVTVFNKLVTHNVKHAQHATKTFTNHFWKKGA
jgi:ribosomal protein S20